MFLSGNYTLIHSVSLYNIHKKDFSTKPIDIMENHEELIQEVKHLIGANRTEKALELLAKAQLSDLDKDLIILNSRYSKVKEDQRLGVIDEDLAQRRLNTINRDLLELSEKIGKRPIRTVSYITFQKEKKFNKWWVVISFLIVALVGSYFIMYDNPVTETEETNSVPQLDEITLANKKYNDLVLEGNNLLRKKEYRDAKSKYDEAMVAAHGFEINTQAAIHGIEICKIELQKKTPKNPQPVAGNKNNFGREGVDACFAINNKFYVFKGSEFIIYSPGEGILEGYPMTINEGFPGIPLEFQNGIDAAFVNHDDDNRVVYMFRKDKYLRYFVENRKVDGGYPKSIQKNWGLPQQFTYDLDAAFYYKDGIAYLFKGNKYVKHTFGSKVSGFSDIEKNWGFGVYFNRVSAACRFPFNAEDSYIFSETEYLKHLMGRNVDPPKKIDFTDKLF
jgi:hypothetical protein